MKPQTKKSEALDYQASGAAMKAEAMSAEFAEITATYRKFDTAARGIESNSIAAANLARQIGLLLSAATGHQVQIPFEFWQKNCEGKLPFDFSAAKLFLGMSRKMAQPATSLGEVVPHVRSILLADNLFELASREVEHFASTTSLFQKMLCAITRLREPYGKMLWENPINKWDARRCQTFLDETDWIVRERIKVEERMEKAK